jgi:formamidopyrimidine-DNA glycosylase
VPELVEVEYYRRLAERSLGRRIAVVDAPDAWYLKRGTTADSLAAALIGRSFSAARRIGKLLLLDTTVEWQRIDVESTPPGSEITPGGPTLGLRFGMTGRLVVDGSAGIDHLAYASTRPVPAWDRLTLGFADGGALRLTDARRLGGVELDPDEDHLGPDALTVGPAALRLLLSRSRAPLKARLMDQGGVAGIGNLICDETLWRASLDPARPANSLSPAEIRRLHRHLRATMADLLERGGSHTGDLQVARVRGATCPRDGAQLERRTIGGRTSYSCPRHQR